MDNDIHLPKREKKQKILIVDDEMAMRFLLEGQLRRAGYCVRTAADGQDALHAMDAFAPDLVLLDLMMPGMNGFEVCERMRQKPGLGETRIMFLTASMTRHNREQAFQVGADDYLMKPYQLDTLLQRVSAVLRKQVAVQAKSQTIVLLGAAHRVGTTTLAIQLVDELTIEQQRPVVVLDLAGEYGALASRLDLGLIPTVMDVFALGDVSASAETLLHSAQRYRKHCWVLPAHLARTVQTDLDAAMLQYWVKTLTAAGYTVVIDAGTTLTLLSQTALNLADVVGVVSAEGADNMAAIANQLNLDPGEIYPVATGDPLRRLQSRFAAEQEKRPFLWVQEQGVSQLLSIG